MIEQKKLKELVKLMVENDLTELDLQSEGERVSLKRSAGQPPVQYVPAPGAPGAPGGAAPVPPPAANQAGADESGGMPCITSPMVGTFYTSPSPDADPFVRVGDRVDPETVVCLVEAMKVFNEIKAETAGTIEKVLAGNGQAVEFAQALFSVKPG